MKLPAIHLWLIASFALLALAKKIPGNKLHSTFLDKHERIKMSWLIDWVKEEVYFYVKDAFQKEDNFFYLGFSQRGNFPDSDVCFFQLPPPPSPSSNDIDNSAEKEEEDLGGKVTDTYSSGDAIFISRDKKQNCKLLKMGDTFVAFKRKFDTCDPQDFRFHEGTMYLIWGRGNDDLNFETSLEKESINVREEDMVMLQLLRADKIDIPEKEEIQSTEIVLNNVEIPAQETTYWCKIQKLPPIIQDKKHHIVQFEPVINSTYKGKSRSFVHHLEVFHCEAPADEEIPLYDGDCNETPPEAEVCKRVISLWAMGASVFTYPPETGLPVGGKDYNPYIRLEVHFNNPDIIDGAFDSSGMKINFISKLRKYDAAVMELGLEYTDKMAIPPGQIGFPVSGYCIAECTEVSLPKKGIVVFGSQLHTHLRGVRIMTRHFRGEKELEELNRDDYYSHHFQEIRQLRKKPKVLPGDALVTTCYYDTQGYKNATLGGFSISDEMCVNYIHYYPATKLELCKSSVSEKTLSDYFEFMEKSERQRIQVGGARSENYKAIRWTDIRVDELYALYTQEPLSMQCNRSDGNRFEGFNWEGAPITPVKIQVPSHGDPSCRRDKFWTKPIEDGLCDLLGECIY